MKCTEPMPTAAGAPCGREGMKQWDGLGYVWFCSVHGFMTVQWDEVERETKQ